MKIRIAPALLALALALTAAACGESGDVERIATVPPASTGPATAGQQGDGRAGAGRAAGDARAARRRRHSCEGILSPPFAEGACVNEGNRLVIANGRSVLRLRSMSVALQGFEVAPELGAASPQQGVFMLIRMVVQNRTGRPARFGLGQTRLLIAGQQFEERTDVEEAHSEQALAFNDRAPIPPGGRAEGTVVYDLPTSMIERVTREGDLLVINFEGNAGGRMPEFGQLRIYRE